MPARPAPARRRRHAPSPPASARDGADRPPAPRPEWPPRATRPPRPGRRHRDLEEGAPSWRSNRRGGRHRLAVPVRVGVRDSRRPSRGRGAAGLPAARSSGTAARLSRRWPRHRGLGVPDGGQVDCRRPGQQQPEVIQDPVPGARRQGIRGRERSSPHRIASTATAGRGGHRDGSAGSGARSRKEPSVASSGSRASRTAPPPAGDLLAPPATWEDGLTAVRPVRGPGFPVAPRDCRSPSSGPLSMRTVIVGSKAGSRQRGYPPGCPPSRARPVQRVENSPGSGGVADPLGIGLPRPATLAHGSLSARSLETGPFATGPDDPPDDSLLELEGLALAGCPRSRSRRPTSPRRAWPAGPGRMPSPTRARTRPPHRHPSLAPGRG